MNSPRELCTRLWLVATVRRNLRSFYPKETALSEIAAQCRYFGDLVKVR